MLKFTTAAVAAVFAVSGCASTSGMGNPESLSPSTVVTPTKSESANVVEAPERLPLEITDKAYTVDDFGDTIYVQWVVVYRNPNDVAGRFPTFRVTAKDKSGKILGTDESVTGEIGPQQTSAWTNQLPVNEIPATVDIEFVTAEWLERSASPADYPAFLAENLSLTDSGLRYLVTGEITNPLPDTLDTRVTAVLRDSAGRVVGAGQAYPTLSGGAATPFEVDAWVDSPPKVVEVYTQPW